MSVSSETLEKVADIARDLLEERFGDDFVFDPIFVKEKVDHDDEEYLEIYIIYDGDYAKLDPGWTVGLGLRMMPALLEIGVTEPPAHALAEKSDWEAGPPK